MTFLFHLQTKEFRENGKSMLLKYVRNDNKDIISLSHTWIKDGLSNVVFLHYKTILKK